MLRLHPTAKKFTQTYAQSLPHALLVVVVGRETGYSRLQIILLLNRELY